MQQIGELVGKIELKKPKIFTPEQSLCEEIWLYFGKKLPFPRIMREIKTKGRQAIYGAFNEVRKSEAKDKLALFVWKSKQEKIVWISQ